MTTGLLGAPGAVAAGPAPARRWWRPDAATVVLALAYALVVVPRLVQTLTSPKYRTAVGEPVPYQSLANLASHLLTYGLAACCAVIVLRRLQDLPTRRRAALLALLAPWCYLVARDLYSGGRPKIVTLLYPLLVLALWVLQPPLERLVVIGHLTAVTAAVSILLGVLLPAKGIFSSVTGDLIAPEKQLLPWGLLIGPFTDSNNLGQCLCLGLPCLAFVTRPVLRAALMAMVVVTIAWSSSRSSLGAVAVAGLAALLVLTVPRAARKAAAGGLLATLAALLVLLPLTVRSNAAFTNRGYIWRLSLERWWQQDPLLGLGPRWYAQTGRYSNGITSTAYHGHNELVQMLVTGGLVNIALVVLFAATLGVAAVRFAAAGQAQPTAFLAALLVSCTLEVSFGFVDRNFLLATTVVPAAVLAFARIPPVPPEWAPAPRRRRLVHF